MKNKERELPSRSSSEMGKTGANNTHAQFNKWSFCHSTTEVDRCFSVITAINATPLSMRLVNVPISYIAKRKNDQKYNEIR